MEESGGDGLEMGGVNEEVFNGSGVVMLDGGGNVERECQIRTLSLVDGSDVQTKTRESFNPVPRGSELGPQESSFADAVIRLEKSGDEEVSLNGTAASSAMKPLGTIHGGVANVTRLTLMCDRQCVVFDGECVVHGGRDDKFELFEEAVERWLLEDSSFEHPVEVSSSDDVRHLLPAGGAGLRDLGYVPRASGAPDDSTRSMLSSTGRLMQVPTDLSSRLQETSAGPTSFNSATAVSAARDDSRVPIIGTGESTIMNDEEDVHVMDVDRTDILTESGVSTTGDSLNGGVDNWNLEEWLSSENGVFRIAKECVNPEHNERLRVAALSEADTTTDVAIPVEGTKGMVWFDGHVFPTREIFKLYYLADKSKERVFRGVALNLKRGARAEEWLSRLSENLKKAGVDESVLGQWKQDADGLWDGKNPSTWTCKSATATSSTATKNMLDTTQEPKEIFLAVDPTSEMLDMAVRNVTVTAKPKGLVMRVRGRINSQDVIVLNDSGADCSVISKGLAMSLGLAVKPTLKPVSIQNPNGTPFSVSGEVKTTIRFNNGLHSLPLRAIVLNDLVGDLIVGDDFLRENKAVLAYGVGVVRYGDFDVPVLDQVSYVDPTYKKTDGIAVTVGVDLLLKKAKRVEILAKVVLPAGFKYGRYAWRFEPLPALADAFEGLGCCDCIVTLVDVNTTAAVVFANSHGLKDIVIPSGTVIGRLRTLKPAADTALVPALECVTLIRNIVSGSSQSYQEWTFARCQQV